MPAITHTVSPAQYRHYLQWIAAVWAGTAVSLPDDISLFILRQHERCEVITAHVQQ